MLNINVQHNIKVDVTEISCENVNRRHMAGDRV
jgi:hypothetical protein